MMKIARIISHDYYPQRNPDKIYIVSSIVKQAYPDRDDFVVPAGLVRNEKGEVLYATALAI
ncbi:MAG: hypothetical protein N3A54_07060 [Patescibacteria group bacterium]|nr:hypothetical protein [Patescibacteria group bacterium]